MRDEVKRVRRQVVICVTSAAALAAPSTANACSVCFGDPASPQVQAMKAGILLLLGVVLAVLGSFGGLFLHWMLRSRRLALAQEKEASL